ncbi:uncharacterized protein KY384_001496 [Bacidia gigantensis]|uniref:uncharacterized protein n=1 Tax=Bacidia gigantensis TaxID=2732470 RepID=UPI001D03E7BA|nr:uncharacterized protein KY384_001496 [Bacidia gigantensis]KAG8533755.1 hypothetical protein KY384_001496 [Bacidia gigantensis]
MVTVQPAYSVEADFALSPAETASSHGSVPPNGDPRLEGASPKENTASLPKQASPAASTGLNPRSCVTCRKRKVRCDKKHPCSNCSKANSECIFPGPGRAPRRSRKPQDTELLARLRRLEGVVQGLGKGVDDGVDIPSTGGLSSELDGCQVSGEGDVKKTNAMYPEIPGEFDPRKVKNEDEGANGVVKEFGRLVVDEGRSRYVSNKFWTSLSEEVTELRDILDDPTDDEYDFPSPGSGSSASTNQHSFLFGYHSTAFSLRSCHPAPEHIPIYWTIFKNNVDPVLKLLHTPSTEAIVLKAAEHLDRISKGLEALMFSIYFASVTSLSAEDCLAVLGVDKHASLQRYRFAVEQAFARANFLNTQDFTVLQAMLLFLTCVRRADDTRYVWTMTGLLLRLAQALGIHRDGRQFQLSPLQTELRRRFWWHLLSLDVRASEDQGCDPSMVEQAFDTKFPMNINDAEIDSTMKEPPVEHEGATEMTFDLIRFEVSTTVRRLSYVPSGPGPCRLRNAVLSLEDKEKMIENLHQHIEKKYLEHCNTAVEPLHWVSATVARLIMAKMWLVVHHPFQRSDGGEGLPQETKDRLFHTSIEVIEFARLLETEKTTLKWGWLFRTYVQWHALAYVLSSLCNRTSGPDVDRAWLVIEGAFNEWNQHFGSSQRGMLWKPLRKLMARARAERAKVLQARAVFPLDGSIGPTAMNMNKEPSQEVNSSVPELLAFDPASEGTFTGQGETIGMESSPITLSPFSPIIADDSVPIGEQNLNGFASGTEHWNSDAELFSREAPMMPEESNMNWSSWNDMVKDYENPIAAVDVNASMGFGPQGLTNWF